MGRNGPDAGAGSGLPAGAVLAVSFLVGSVPFAQLVARIRGGGDLRHQGSGTVSATGLGQVAGNRSLVLAGGLDVAKGTVGPLLAGPRRRPTVAALAGGAAVAGHNWSPLLAGAGGRGISPALGALAVTAPAGSLILLAGVGLGRGARQTGLGALVGYAVLVPALHRLGGPGAARAGAFVLIPILVKRLTGNRPVPNRPAYLWRLLFDRDERRRPAVRLVP
ncbi:MAG: glycerol-3-phosphate acyltransferase [Actinomycetes bacterium]